MVDPDVLRAKSAAVLHHVERLRKRSPIQPSALEVDEDLWNIVLMDLQQAIQACIDLAAHLCVDEALGAPEGPASAFALMANAGIIDQALALKLVGAAGLRNLIVHRYGDLRAVTIVDIVERDLVQLEAFIAAVRSHAAQA